MTNPHQHEYREHLRWLSGEIEMLSNDIAPIDNVDAALMVGYASQLINMAHEIMNYELTHGEDETHRKAVHGEAVAINEVRNQALSDGNYCEPGRQTGSLYG